MNEDMRLIVKCALIVLLTALVLVSYARACQCEICGSPYGIYRRVPYPEEPMDLCRHHARLYRRSRRFQRHRFAALRGLWRNAA